MTLIEIVKENNVSEPIDPAMEPEMEDGWGDAPPANVTALPVTSPPMVKPAPAASAPGGTVYTEHRISISWKVDDAIVAVRGDDASEVIQVMQELDQYGAYAALGHAKQAVMGYMPKPVITPPQRPAQPAQPGPGGWQAGPGQSPGQPPFGGMPPQAPQQQYGGAPQAPQGRSGAKPCPPGWFKIDVPYNAKDEFKEYRNQNQQHFRGKVSWGGGGTYWIAPDAVAWFQQYGPVPQ